MRAAAAIAGEAAGAATVATGGSGCGVGFRVHAGVAAGAGVLIVDALATRVLRVRGTGSSGSVLRESAATAWAVTHTGV